MPHPRFALRTKYEEKEEEINEEREKIKKTNNWQNYYMVEDVRERYKALNGNSYQKKKGNTNSTLKYLQN